MYTELSVNQETISKICNITFLFCILGIVIIVVFSPRAMSAESNSQSDGIHWKKVSDHLSVATLDLPLGSNSAKNTVSVLRLKKDYWVFHTYDYRTTDGKRKSAREWLELTNSSIILNAGQYDTDFKHLGWLIENAINMGSRRHPNWNGLLVSQKNDSSDLPLITVIDLENNSLSLKSLQYPSAVQSIMLLDRDGTIRVNKSSNLARRSVIGLAENGDILIFVTDSMISLWEFGDYLKHHELNVEYAISLDGGSEAQLSVTDAEFVLDTPGYQIPLPCVIGFEKVIKKRDSR